MAKLSRFIGYATYQLLPDDCRICEEPLLHLSRVPVCLSCLTVPQPLATEFSCRSCKTPFLDHSNLDDENLCLICREGGLNFDSTFSYGGYDGVLRKLIHLFKYGKVESLAGVLGGLTVRALPLDLQIDIVLAMPMHWRKRWSRGFNQAELLARPVAARYGLKLASNLQRSRRTKAQASLTEAERKKNLRNSFRVVRPQELRDKRVLLVDDVMTTGATLREATFALKAAGCRSVTALTLARVDNPRWSATQPKNLSNSLQALQKAISLESEPVHEL